MVVLFQCPEVHGASVFADGTSNGTRILREIVVLYCIIEKCHYGVDILAEKDSITYAIQCKCYSSNIGNAAIQQIHSGKSLYHKDVAVVLTNQYFTTQARKEANALNVKLWDRDKLYEMIKNIT